ncbi:MAG TPA: hypothetical protein PKA61_02020 [Nitrospira sp.]|nr:hypothetical protein [Nitrospira sp.]
MRSVNTVSRFIGSAITLTLLLTLTITAAHAAPARVAKDGGERSKAVAMAARYLQGPGFADPMLAAETAPDASLSVEVDHKGWARMDREQKMDFLDRINGGVLRASGGVSIDIHVSMNGSKVATSMFSSGQQVMRLVD